MGTIDVRGVEKAYPGLLRRKKALRGLSLEVEAGEVFGLIGPNGAGKTTLMGCLLGLLRPDRGTVRVNGLPPDDLATRARTGYLPERLGFEPDLRGGELLVFHGRLAGLSAAAAREAPAREARLLELPDEALARPLRTYSRGMLQRIGLAQALVGRPALLFLDEPTSGMDPTGVAIARRRIREAKAAGTTVLLSSHQLVEVERVCDRVAFVAGGRIARTESLRGGHRARSWAVRVAPGHEDRARAVLAASGMATRSREDGLHVTGASIDAGRIARPLPARAMQPHCCRTTRASYLLKSSLVTWPASWPPASLRAA